ncbi:hypothetical protein OKW38_005550 [Paraburkholderia sp. MM5496-R1]|uniref:Uncharacterized protein n=1 Tax=Paraburkholderia tuberum TaxID=157910 RepID=A0A1H1J8T9_9BURK|nr:hypothetical protein [Paraburkholderia tuberum]SDR46036.1 hypothetical protein SAMN05445850_4333 [Paraburkholderia tuberum]
MPFIESKLNPRSDDFRANAAALEALVTVFCAREKFYKFEAVR